MSTAGSPIPGVLNQRIYPGAGDPDDCWVVATIWAAICAFPAAIRPTITTFRKFAGVPDQPGPTGGTVYTAYKGAHAVWPYMSLRIVRDWTTFMDLLKAGRPMSLSVHSAYLPTKYRFGFNGLHQVGIVWDGTDILLANPLAPEGSRPMPITSSALRAAAAAFPGGVQALAFPAPNVASPHIGGVMSVYQKENLNGRFTVKAGTTPRGWVPEGDGWKVVKQWLKKTTDSTTSFDYILRRISGSAVPSVLLHVPAGFFAGQFVSSAEVDEAVATPPETFTQAQVDAMLADMKASISADEVEDAAIAASLKGLADKLTD